MNSIEIFKTLIDEFGVHIKNIVLAVSKTITEFFYNGGTITTRGILFLAYVAVVFVISIFSLLFRRR